MAQAASVDIAEVAESSPPSGPQEILSNSPPHAAEAMHTDAAREEEEDHHHSPSTAGAKDDMHAEEAGVDDMHAEEAGVDVVLDGMVGTAPEAVPSAMGVLAGRKQEMEALLATALTRVCSSL